jgi:hypothetical protein
MLQYKAKDQKVCEKSIKESNLLSKKLNKWNHFVLEDGIHFLCTLLIGYSSKIIIVYILIISFLFFFFSPFSTFFFKKSFKEYNYHSWSFLVILEANQHTRGNMNHHTFTLLFCFLFIGFDFLTFLPYQQDNVH